MPAYSWRCLACELANDAVHETCQKCACPANATYAQIAAAKKSAGIVDPVDGPTLSELVAAGWKNFVGKSDDRSILVNLIYENALGAAVVMVFFALVKAWELLGH